MYYMACTCLNFTELSFKLLLLVSNIWKGPYYYALRKYLTILLKCRQLKCLGKTLLLPFSNIFTPLNSVTLHTFHTFGKDLAILLCELVLP